MPPINTVIGTNRFSVAIGSDKPLPGELTAELGKRFEIISSGGKNGGADE